MSLIDWPKRATGRTWESLEKGEPDLYWQHIRSMRVAGRGFAASGARRSIFRAALQQSEQLFRAAETVDYSVRPLLAFYGLTQACVAVIQASPRLTKEEAASKGHGMGFEPDLNGIGKVAETSDQRGTMTLLRKATASGGIGGSASIERIWSTLPEHRRGFSILPDRSLLPLYVNLPSSEGSDEVSISVPDTSLRGADFPSTLSMLKQSRPQMAVLDLQQARFGDRWSDIGKDGFTLYTVASDPANLRREIVLANTYYDTLNPRLFASLDGSASVHPLVAWLAVLYGLSMLARYSPERWAQLLQIDGSTSAPLLEDVLQCANVICPPLILNTLDHMDVLCVEGVKPA